MVGSAGKWGALGGVMAGGDVRGFYASLGIELAGWARSEAAVSCFADPGTHKHADRSRSCSVNVDSGLWHCHGCGAAGGPYDAAIARGRSPRAAMDLLIEHRLAKRRSLPGDHVGGGAAGHARGSLPGVERGRAARR